MSRQEINDTRLVHSRLSGECQFNGAGGGNRTLTGLPPTDFRTIYGFRRLAWRVRDYY